MPQPDTSLSTLRPDLASSLMEFDLAADRAGFIGLRIAPVLEVAIQAGTFGKIELKELLQTAETRRAPGAGYNRGDFVFTPETYACEEHGREAVLDDRERKMYAAYFDFELVGAQRALDLVLRAAEQRWATALFNTTVWTGSDLTTEVTNEWDDADNATPIVNVEAAVQKVFDNTGMWPNALIINRKVFRNLRNCDEIIDRCKAQGFMDVRAGSITEAQLQAVFDLPYIIVAGSAKNTADLGQSASISPLWSGEYAMVCRLATSNDPQEPCIARTFHWADDGSIVGGCLETYRDEPVRGDAVRVRHDVDEMVMYPEMGHLLANITS